MNRKGRIPGIPAVGEASRFIFWPAQGLPVELSILDRGERSFCPRGTQLHGNEDKNQHDRNSSFVSLSNVSFMGVVSIPEINFCIIYIQMITASWFEKTHCFSLIVGNPLWPNCRVKVPQPQNTTDRYRHSTASSDTSEQRTPAPLNSSPTITLNSYLPRLPISNVIQGSGARRTFLQQWTSDEIHGLFRGSE